jgi:hypothetical protein
MKTKESFLFLFLQKKLLRAGLETLPLGADEQATLARLRDATAAADSEARATAQAALCMVGVR